MRRDLSLLLLATPMMPPAAATPAAPIGDVPIGAVARPPVAPPVAPGVVVAPAPAPVPGAACPPRCPRPAAEFAPCWAAVRIWKSPPVIGSLYFLRRNRWSTSRSMLGGNALAVFLWNSAIAWTY